MSACTALEAIQLNTTPQTFIYVLRLKVCKVGPKRSSAVNSKGAAGSIHSRGSLPMFAHSRFSLLTVHTGVNDISGNPCTTRAFDLTRRSVPATPSWIASWASCVLRVPTHALQGTRGTPLSP